ncbi:hypothetical protein BsWGS_04646 [Bradybaena similaris]
MESDFIGSTLTNIMIVVERIFRNLSARQLNTCSRVCKVWRDQAKREKERRQYFKWNCFLVDHAASVGGDNKSWWQSVTNFILESPIEPKCLLIFCSHSLWAMLTEDKPEGQEENEVQISAAELFGPYLPKDCNFHIVLTDGIVGTDANMKTLELDREEYDEALSLIMFGETFGVKFVPFSLTHQECVSLKKYWSEANARIPRCMQPLLNKEIKMINLYCPMNGIDQEIGYSLFRIFKWPLVAGGYVNEKHVRDSHGNFFSSVLDRSCVVSGLAICGANVKVASVLIRSQDIAEVERNVQTLTEHKFPLHRSFGLMYACVGRGSHVYGKQNVESSIFRKYFPTTPLLGFFGNGEVGCKFPPVDPLFVGDPELRSRIQSSKTKISSSGNRSARMSEKELMRQLEERRQQQEAYKMKHPPKILHAYTTVMCLVSLP